MNIRTALSKDMDFMLDYDKHISRNELENAISLGRIYIAWENETYLGWLRYNLFWDNTPFMNMLFVIEDYRSRGIGKALVNHWEHEMRKQGYSCLMTSTASDEYVQHFYNKLGYIAVGGFTPKNEPYEIILLKSL